MLSKPVILAIEGLAFTADEAALFSSERPFGFIVFSRNILDPPQLSNLVAHFRDLVGDPTAPVLIDQEGGRVARLREPHWETFPSARAIGVLYEHAAEKGLAAARLQGQLLGQQAKLLGINVLCTPVLDLTVPGADAVMGDRCFSPDPAVVAVLARAECEGLRAAGVLPVLKHIPGHGRATADSHHTLPTVSSDVETLALTDFAPFKALADMPLAMTAHILYDAIDPLCCATLSSKVISDTIRRHMGFQGLLMSDDLAMQALTLPKPEAARAALAAGCDVALECKGIYKDNLAVLNALGPMGGATLQRWQQALAWLPASPSLGASRVHFDELFIV